ncbi:MAG: 2-C-methyl-D-erythritol 4-phosphate cytidylyltransferase [Candidatus Poribacteria bacterium]|nr:2-C-methyl-D-erythritol 4-phosphate cytidylyltransferase [Candidatus Poribacteria bacterium]
MRQLAAAVAPSAGKGSRMGGSVKKTYIELKGRPLAAHTLEALAASPLLGEIVWVAAEEDAERCRALLEEWGLDSRFKVAAGGASRQESVYRGLLALTSDAPYVLIHDGARPCVATETIRRCLEAAEKHGAALAAVPVKDALWSADADGHIGASVARGGLWRAQTPQAFQRELIVQAHEAARRNGFEASDDAALALRFGVPPKIVLGDERNVKATTPDDLALIERILSARKGG